MTEEEDDFFFQIQSCLNMLMIQAGEQEPNQIFSFSFRAQYVGTVISACKQ